MPLQKSMHIFGQLRTNPFRAGDFLDARLYAAA